MSFAHSLLTYIHVAVGFTSLILFWIPIASRKGSTLHNKVGRWYANAMYVVAVTAMLMSVLVLYDPVAAKHPQLQLQAEELAGLLYRERQVALFLLAIAFLVFANVRHGLLTLRSKTDHQLMRAPSHLALNAILGVLGVSLIFVATGSFKILFYVFAGLCISASLGNLRYCLKTEVPRMEWLIAHLSSMIGAGIGSYTAFFVFGGNRFLQEILTGQWMLVPWIAPGVIGGICIAYQSNKYRNKYQKSSKPKTQSSLPQSAG
ncbi:MAG: hypothetical protein AAF431_19675 [Pseudomonadota bacterium]